MPLKQPRRRLDKPPGAQNSSRLEITLWAQRAEEQRRLPGRELGPAKEPNTKAMATGGRPGHTAAGRREPAGALTRPVRKART